MAEPTRTYPYLVAVLLRDENGARVGEEMVHLDAYSALDAITQAIIEVSARNSATERNLKVDVAWIGPDLSGVVKRAKQAIEAFYLARQAVKGRTS